MLSEKNNILILNQYAKSIYEDQMPYIIYDDIKSLSKNLHGGANNPENASTTRRAYPLSIFNVNHLGIWSYRKQAYIILRKIVYGIVLQLVQKGSYKYT